MFKNFEIKNVYNLYKIKLLCLNRTVEDGLSKALEHIRIAEKIFSRLAMHLSCRTACCLRCSIENSLFEIKKIKEKAIVKAKLSSHKVCDIDINTAVCRTRKFVFTMQENDLMWADFMTSAGKGTGWITAFVLCMLGEFQENKRNLDGAMQKLLQNGGRYNEHLIEDCDSCNFLLRAKQLMGYAITQDDINKWLKFKHPSGGFSTYDNDVIKRVIHFSEESNVQGWLQEHNCVSSVACWVSKFMNNRKVYADIRNFLEEQVDDKGELTSYWWTEPIYTMAFSVMAGIRGDILTSLLGKQSPVGYWLNMGKPSVFYTAISLKALLETLSEGGGVFVAS